jgi:hypothetical protein
VGPGGATFCPETSGPSALTAAAGHCDAGDASKHVGIRPFGYLTSMVVTIALWLTLAPAVGAIARVGPKKK